MNTIETVILGLHVLAALAVIGLVLIQHGKGADAGAGFGGGSSSTVFGSGGAGNFLTRMTTGIVITFFITSFVLAFFAKEKSLTVQTLGIPMVQQQTLPETGAVPSIDTSEYDTPAFDGGSGSDNASGIENSEIPGG
ncbi:MAG: preprotein translocase subunit SecG [Candidatus Azotimanducaceae bacterium]|jgi:preprotein translocase subunit SecG